MFWNLSAKPLMTFNYKLLGNGARSGFPFFCIWFRTFVPSSYKWLFTEQVFRVLHTVIMYLVNRINKDGVRLDVIMSYIYKNVA